MVSFKLLTQSRKGCTMPPTK